MKRDVATAPRASPPPFAPIRTVPRTRPTLAQLIEAERWSGNAPLWFAGGMALGIVQYAAAPREIAWIAVFGLLAVAAYGLYEILDHYLWRASKSTKTGGGKSVRPLPQPEPAGTQVGGAVLTGGGEGTRPDTDEDSGFHSSTVVCRGVVSRRTNA